MRVALFGGSRLALFGGSFDPPHRGHIAIAKAAADAFALDRVFFAPAARQPLKLNTTAASFDQRLVMVVLACDADPRFEASELDAPRLDGQPNYTVDTLAQLAELHPRAKLFNLVGADSFLTVGRWREPERLLSLAEWIVVSRPGFPLLEPTGMTLSAAQQARIHLLDSVHEDVAATTLRERLQHGDPCADLLPPLVSTYIRQRHLYLNAPVQIPAAGTQPDKPIP